MFLSEEKFRRLRGPSSLKKKKIRHREKKQQFYVLLQILTHMHYTHKTMKPLGSAPNGFGEF